MKSGLALVSPERRKEISRMGGYARWDKSPEKRSRKMERTYSESEVRRLLSQLGVGQRAFKRLEAEVKLTRKDVKAIRKRLNADGLVCLRRKTTRPDDFEFVSKDRITIRDGRPGNLPRAKRGAGVKLFRPGGSPFARSAETRERMRQAALRRYAEIRQQKAAEALETAAAK
jgi:hypothetical protein